MFRTISSKLIVSICIITALNIAIISYFYIKHHHDHLILEVLRGVNRVSDTIKRSTRYDMLLDHREDVHRMIEHIGKQDGIEVIRIFNKEGKIMFSTNKVEMNKYVDKDTEACYMCHNSEYPISQLSTTERSRIYYSNNHRVLAMITPINNEPDCYEAACHAHKKEQKILGVLDIGMSLVRIDTDIMKNRKLVIYFTLITILFISSILYFYATKIIVSPVKQLVLGTKRVARGDLSVQIPVKTLDEIGDLAVSFNHMIYDLKKAREEIHQWKNELEKKVEERTEKLRLTKEQLLHSEKMASLGVLASSVAHEINNPLQGILTYIKLMIRIIGGKNFNIDRISEFNNYLYLMSDEIKRCGNIVNNLLVFSRHSKAEIQEANINDIILTTLILLDNKIRHENIDVLLNLDKNFHKIHCDSSQIQQTLVALIINAIESMMGGGEIIISTENLNNENVKIILEDTGIGISEENISKIFDPFFSTKESEKSTGLGLSVAYGIIKEHNGTIDVASKVGEGTRFTIVLPCRSANYDMN